MATPNGKEQTRSVVLRLPHGRSLELAGTPRVMGVLNITPDSFSDGGRWIEADRAVEHGLEMLAEGADLLDLGAESTRPGGGVYGEGAEPVSESEEADRLLPVLEKLRPETDHPLSIDTRKASVARQALAAGGDLINDVSALGDREMAGVVAAGAAPLILMHSRGSLETMQRGIRFQDLLGEIGAELAERAGRAIEGGVGAGALLVDPGIGFGKTAAQNVEILAGLEELHALGFPLVVGASRKSFIAALTGAAVGERLPGSLAAVGAAADRGAAMVRVHDVAETVQFLTVWEAVRSARSGRGRAA